MATAEDSSYDFSKLIKAKKRDNNFHCNIINNVNKLQILAMQLL